MIIVDNALVRREAENRPILYGLSGVGFIGRGILNQGRHHRGLRCAAVCNRTISTALSTLRDAGVEKVEPVSSLDAFDQAVRSGSVAVTDDPALLCSSASIECVIEATGHVEYGARVVTTAIEHGKQVVLLNAELDGTVGPILKAKADKAGVIYTGCDGDQPAVEMNLFRFVSGLGLDPLLCGSIKGLHDPYRNPATQESFARRWGQSAAMVTSFADGTKVSFEQAIVANATGMRVAKRGMSGLVHAGHVDELPGRYDVDELRALGGVVDFVVGARPSPGVFLLAAARDSTQSRFLRLGKLGEGPLYCFYVPYHLTALEAPVTVARAVDFGDAAIAPAAGPVVDVIALAKRDLRSGEVIDGLGGYMAYGACENHDTAREQGLLPMGMAEGSVLRHHVGRDAAIRIEDVIYPPGRLVDALLAEQDETFPQNGARRDAV
ncbi:MAG: NAD(P)-dependent oxidoreductase [Acidimicrobiia bacterium]